jgi:hypothetical protein
VNRIDATRHYAYSLTYDSADAARVQAIVAGCNSTYFEAVSRAWATYRPSNLDEVFASARHDVALCMNNAGVDVNPNPPHSQFTDWLIGDDPLFARCLNEVQTSHDLRGLLP